jgi:uncharacterized protein
MHTGTDALIIFAKNAVAGTVKTRLAETLGANHALAVYTRLLNQTLDVTAQIDCKRFLFFNSFIPDEPDPRAQSCAIRVQCPGDLGTRMEDAMTHLLVSHAKAVLIGSDIADLDANVIREAFQALSFAHCVIGPAHDGGYYLIGSKDPVPDVIKEIPWGTASVYRDTIDRLLHTGVSFAILPERHDIDTESDLHKFPWLK